MGELNLGPNGALVYCVDFLSQNIKWLEEKLSQTPKCIWIVDLPGQIELYMNSESLLNVVQSIHNKCAGSMIVQLFDSFMSEVKSVRQVQVPLGLSLLAGEPTDDSNPNSDPDIEDRFDADLWGECVAIGAIFDDGGRHPAEELVRHRGRD